MTTRPENTKQTPLGFEPEAILAAWLLSEQAGDDGPAEVSLAALVSSLPTIEPPPRLADKVLARWQRERRSPVWFWLATGLASSILVGLGAMLGLGSMLVTLLRIHPVEVAVVRLLDGLTVTLARLVAWGGGVLVDVFHYGRLAAQVVGRWEVATVSLACLVVATAALLTIQSMVSGRTHHALAPSEE